jgi:hypothetical protein
MARNRVEANEGIIRAGLKSYNEAELNCAKNILVWQLPNLTFLIFYWFIGKKMM